MNTLAFLRLTEKDHFQNVNNTMYHVFVFLIEEMSKLRNRLVFHFYSLNTSCLMDANIAYVQIIYLIYVCVQPKNYFYVLKKLAQ